MDSLIYRFILAFLGGYFLCLSGSLGQLSTHNNLSSPSTLGFTGIGVFSILVGFFLQNVFDLNFSLETLSLAVFLVLILFLSVLIVIRSEVFSDIKNFILLGIGFNLFIGAIFSVVQFILISKGVRFPTGIWFGSFRYVNYHSLFIFPILFVVSLFFVKKYYRDLALMNFGDLFARKYGVLTGKTKFFSLGLSTVLTGVVVIYFGVFSFVGLVAPHILRSSSFFKSSIKNELVIGPFICAFVLSFLDYICYEFTVFNSEIPVGMLSAILGSFSLILILFLSKSKV